MSFLCNHGCYFGFKSCSSLFQCFFDLHFGWNWVLSWYDYCNLKLIELQNSSILILSFSPQLHSLSFYLSLRYSLSNKNYQSICTCKSIKFGTNFTFPQLLSINFPLSQAWLKISHLRFQIWECDHSRCQSCGSSSSLYELFVCWCCIYLSRCDYQSSSNMKVQMRSITGSLTRTLWNPNSLVLRDVLEGTRRIMHHYCKSSWF